MTLRLMWTHCRIDNTHCQIDNFGPKNIVILTMPEPLIFAVYVNDFSLENLEISQSNRKIGKNAFHNFATISYVTKKMSLWWKTEIFNIQAILELR